MICDQPSYRQYAFKIIFTAILLKSFLVVERCTALSQPQPSSFAAKAVHPQESQNHYYIALYKPALTLCTFRDDEERAKRKHREARSTLTTVLLENTGKNSIEGALPRDIIIPMHDNGDDKDQKSRKVLHTCGRLDRDSEGLLLLTTDGSFTNRVCEPKLSEGITKVPKRYLVRVKNGVPNDTAMNRMRAGGLVIRGATIRPPVSVQVIEDDSPELQQLPPPVPGMEDRHKQRRVDIQAQEYAWLEIILTEGRNRQVRRITADAGHPTVRLVRVAVGDLTLADQDLYRPGQWCYIAPEDVLGAL